MAIARVYLDAARRGRLICSACGTLQTVVVGAAYVGGPPRSVTCGTCAYVFSAQFDRRRHHRRPVHLPGQLTLEGPGAPTLALWVPSLSASGLAGISRQPLLCHPPARAMVAFRLDTPEATRVTLALHIVRVLGPTFGAVFDPPDSYQHVLDFYLVPNQAALARL
ncbi:MAG: hypothetical protein AB7N91_32030 [Candidatus Tectimicrobiota bacterium]